VTAPLDSRSFRQALGRFASGVTVVTTVAAGTDHALTVSAFSSVSLEPPLVLICVDHKNRFHDAVMTSGSWAVSMLAESAQDAATWFATRGRPLEGQLDKVPYRRGDVTGAALLEGALAWLECRTSRVHEGGDHSIVVGEVLWAEVAAGADDPLLYYRSHYGALLHSAASERSVLALRDAIVEDAEHPSSGERTTSA
jgi:flavin reductase (DIM6/NTAB) family NADH-FMN oxidoreductase RutF